MSKLKLNKVIIAPCGDKVRRNNKSSKSKRASGKKISKDSFKIHQCQLISLTSIFSYNKYNNNNKNGQQQETTKLFKNWECENIQSNN